jgi:2'-5' RNA ligase
MRTFVALDLDDAIREKIVLFVEGVRGFAPEARWVRPESLHVTLKFIGEKTADTVEEIQSALQAVSGKSFEIVFRGYGFFPSAKSARVFWIGVEGGPELGALAASVDTALIGVGVAQEEHAYSPHLTLARGASGAPRRIKGDRRNSQFLRLAEKLEARPAPAFGSMVAHEFCLYQSQLARGGSRYTRIGQFGLG